MDDQKDSDCPIAAARSCPSMLSGLGGDGFDAEAADVTAAVLGGPPLPHGARPRALLSWSTGKDCAWTLAALRRGGRVEIVGLLTTYNDSADRVAMHGVRADVADAIAAAAGIKEWSVRLPSPCTNAVYEAEIGKVMRRAEEEGIAYVAFGDIHLADVREYRLRKMAEGPIKPLFPLWMTDKAHSRELAQEMLEGGLRAILTCVDTKVLPASFVRRQYDAALLEDLPPSACPLGENGEFHTLCFAGPHLAQSVAVRVVPEAAVTRDGFAFAEVVLESEGGSKA